MTTPSYPPPVSNLLTLGEPSLGTNKRWMDYRSLGLTNEHASELIRLAADLKLNLEGDSESTEVFGPLHAWRALAQLKIMEAVEPLLSIIDDLTVNDDDWIREDFPYVFRMIGATSTDPVIAFLKDKSHPEDARELAALILGEIGGFIAESRPKCIAALREELEQYKQNDPGYNAVLVGTLAGIYADECVPLIVEAYSNGCIMDGSPYWEDAMEVFGLQYSKDKK